MNQCDGMKNFKRDKKGKFLDPVPFESEKELHCKYLEGHLPECLDYAWEMKVFFYVLFLLCQQGVDFCL